MREVSQTASVTGGGGSARAQTVLMHPVLGPVIVQGRPGSYGGDEW